MHINFKAILFYVTTLTAVLLSCADVLPVKWLPFIIVAAKLADAFTPRAAKRRERTFPPQAGRGQSGHIRLSSLLALLTLCLLLPFVTTGCPRAQGGDAQSASAELRVRAVRATKVAEDTASTIEAVGDATRELRAGGLISDEGARAVARGALDAGNILDAAAEGALNYGGLDEAERADLLRHFDALSAALTSLNETGALHVKNPKRRATLSVLLVASRTLIGRVESDLDQPLPDGLALSLDDELRRRLERTRGTLARSRQKLTQDLARPTPDASSAPL